MKKIKILMLGTHDSPLGGHLLYDYNNLPEYYEKKMVVLHSLKGKKDYAFYDNNDLFYKIHRKLGNIILRIIRYCKYRLFVTIDPDKPQYCYMGVEDTYISAKKILEKCGNFKPDVISIHWASGFISSKTIRNLYDITKAKILFVLVDEAHMTGGCHFSVDCNGYRDKCNNCPALRFGKKLSAIQLAIKMKNLKNLPVFVAGTPLMCKCANSSALFKDAVVFPYVKTVEATPVTRLEARKYLKLPENAFIILLGSSQIHDVRKGVKYSLDAINNWAVNKKDVAVLLLGNVDDADNLFMDGIHVIAPGYLNQSDLFVAFCASNCFLSTTIADSGPMMVNYSIALGTPVISFNVGIAHNLVLHKQTGYLAEYLNVDDIVSGLDYIYNLSITDAEKMAKECIGLMQYYKTQDRWYESLYKYLHSK